MQDRRFTIMATPAEVAPSGDRRLWPVHVTIVGNFRAAEAPDGAFSAGVASVTQDVSAFEVPLGPSTRFGVEHTIPVLLAEHPTLHYLHARLAVHAERLAGFAAVEPAFWDAGYRPHVTLGAAVDASEGESLTIKWLTLIALEGHTGRRLSAIQLDAR